MLTRIALFLEALPLIPRLILGIGLIMVAVGFVEVLSTIERWWPSPYISHCHQWDIFVSEAWSWSMTGVEHMFWWTIFGQRRCTIIISHICDDVKSFSHQFSLAHMFYLTQRIQGASEYCITWICSLCAVWKWVIKMPYPMGWHHHMCLALCAYVLEEEKISPHSMAFSWGASCHHHHHHH